MFNLIIDVREDIFEENEGEVIEEKPSKSKKKNYDSLKYINFQIYDKVKKNFRYLSLPMHLKIL